MTGRPLPILALLAWLAACGGDDAVLVSADGRIRVVHLAEAEGTREAGRAAMQEAMQVQPRIDVVHAGRLALALGAADAAREAGRTGIRFASTGGHPGECRQHVQDGVLDAGIEYPTGGAEAVDLALLAVNGMRDLPREVRLGARVSTRANLAAGGEIVPAPGDVVLADLRRRHAEILTTTPVTDQIWRICLVLLDGADPWQAALAEDVRRNAARYPQLEFVLDDAGGDRAKLRAAFRRRLEQGCHAILVAAGEGGDLAGAGREAQQKDVAVIALGHRPAGDECTVLVGGDDAALGRAAGGAIRELFAGGAGAGNLVLLRDRSGSNAARERHQGLVDALGLSAPR